MVEISEMLRKRSDHADMIAARSRTVFEPDTIVYWCHNNGGGRYDVCYGIVREQWFEKVMVDFLAPRERRRINGVPVKEFEGDKERKKLPKGWGCNTKLYEITYDELSSEEKEFCLDICNPDSIKEAYSKGYLVKKSEIYQGGFNDDITKDGYKVVKTWLGVKYAPDDVTIEPYRLYFNYEDAKKEVDDNIAEFERQANLSDYDWSVEQIDKTLARWVYVRCKTMDEVERYRDYLLSQKDVENIVIRDWCGDIQWKYDHNRKWNNIDLP